MGIVAISVTSKKIDNNARAPKLLLKIVNNCLRKGLEDANVKITSNSRPSFVLVPLAAMKPLASNFLKGDIPEINIEVEI